MKRLHIRIQSFLISLTYICLAVLFLFPFVSKAQDMSHEYAKLTRERVDAAMGEDGTVQDLALAEGSLTALGWMTVYGNDEASFNLVKKLNDIPFNLYNGTDKMDLYMEFTSDAYSEMLNLNRFDSRKPISPSQELVDYARDQVSKTLEKGTSDGDETLIEAEGSLMALGWLIAFGKDNVAYSDKMEKIAYERANVYYSNHNRGYQFMRNFHSFKMDGE